MTSSTYENAVARNIANEKAATAFVKAIHDLFYDKNVETMLFRNQVIDKRPSEILNLHNYARKFVGRNITIHDTTALLEEVLKIDIIPSRFDIGRLGSEWVDEKENFPTMAVFVAQKLVDFIGAANKVETEPKDVVLFGFGRIGRLVARELIAQEGAGQQLRLRAIVARGTDAATLEKRASLLRIDSVHGKFPGTVEVDVAKKSLVINGRPIAIVDGGSPEDIDYTTFGIHDALLIDNTGAFRDHAALSRHLKSKGIAKVLLTAPGKGVPNIVHGVNQALFNPNEVDIFSAASCTTNAIVPILKVINDTYGISRGHVETVHAYTNDQNLVDNMHDKYRRGRAAAMNMVITETGAGSAVDKCIPGLGPKLTSNAIRVPVPDGSLAILSLTIEKQTSRDELNEVIRQAALHGDLVEQINYSLNQELVSSDIVGNPHPSVFDSAATIVHNDGKNINLYVWYDNEYGYSRQVLRLSKYIAQVRRKSYY